MPLPAHETLAALAEPARLEAMRILWGGARPGVGDLMRDLGASQSSVSRHMRRLRLAGLVLNQRDGQWVRYRLNPAMPEATRDILRAALAAPGGNHLQGDAA